MGTMSLSLPDSMTDWVEAQARGDRYSDASDYVRDLIQRDQERRHAVATLQSVVTESLESGVSDRSESDIRRLSREQAAASRGP